MELFAASLSEYKRLKTKEVRIGDLLLGNHHPIRVQTMTTTDTMDTIATVEQTIRCIEAGAELVRITAPSKKEAENLLNIKNELHRRGYSVPLVADIHFTPNAAEIAARIVEKVRVNPGNYVDKKKFEQIDYTDAEYAEEIDRIRERFTPLVKICKEHGTAMRIGTNHGSLSDRIMSRYGDTPIGMVESAMEFLRIARDEDYHQIILSMKSSNPQVMVQAYRLLIKQMDEEFGEIYPLHLGVTEAGDGEEGRIKSAVGIGTLLEDGIGDTIRVSLTEDPEFEIPVCRDMVKRYNSNEVLESEGYESSKGLLGSNGFYPFSFKRHATQAVNNIGGGQVPVVIADFSKAGAITPNSLKSIGYRYNKMLDKWNIADTAADYIYINQEKLDFALPGSLKVIQPYEYWKSNAAISENGSEIKYFPIYGAEHFVGTELSESSIHFVMIDCPKDGKYLEAIVSKPNTVLCLSSQNKNAMQTIRATCILLAQKNIATPIVFITDSNWQTADEHLIHFATETGALFLDGFGDGICLGMSSQAYADFDKTELSGRRYALSFKECRAEAFLNNTAFNILQAARMRISKTEYISCPSCGRTLFDLQETTTKIRSVTNHLKGLKIAIMGCIVNGPGEMADADFGYVGSGPGKITLYKGKEVVKRNITSEVAVDELIILLKENGVWIEP
ncbi:MAG TPA: (E)-4-hydroxy-3-methylbut-2-enyl-diphosphate synthase [Niabella sp.]|nr:(E)-4-hydroxy-3-methylbut-2-enyl-diphosphate synthase [Niabella sp.]HOZ96143.1 (E)-4-hydroxy-3-methylbut-2-enyl-diphosphate synthase [Niabella sp.]HQW13509.1 (E)-4-hydroxy-3-methylbut-2-enyl-diphosphate synthase [Niabella sp.]HQX18903.1 (E)-4-hydroxy-3-methylbut-2-enyl-diphosphate synthase [Niabella sp.]HQX41809.1 (E)-4-hydroxy-3-methylbut-2-enyl-diphosphate synthase [Niabella sp.]